MLLSGTLTAALHVEFGNPVFGFQVPWAVSYVPRGGHSMGAPAVFTIVASTSVAVSHIDQLFPGARCGSETTKSDSFRGTAHSVMPLAH